MFSILSWCFTAFKFLTRFSKGKLWLLDCWMSAGLNNFFCAQLLLHFFIDFNQTFREWLSSCDLVHIIRVLWFNQFWRSYGPWNRKNWPLSLCRTVLKVHDIESWNLHRNGQDVFSTPGVSLPFQFSTSRVISHWNGVK